jgi:hypothetical protein
MGPAQNGISTKGKKAVNDIALYWYCRSITRKGDDRVTEAVLLSSILFHDSDEAFTASLLDERATLPVECRVAGITEIALSEDEHGNPVTLYDGERLPRLTMEELAFCQHVKLNLDADVELGAGPALLTTDSRARFGHQAVEVELVPACIAQLPDFQADIVYQRWFEDRVWNSESDRPPSMAEELEVTAATLKPRSGMVLPVDGPGDDAEHPQALVLGPQLSASPQRFAASLYSFYPTGVVQPGAVLSRTVRWLKDPEQRTWAGAIARVLRTEA